MISYDRRYIAGGFVAALTDHEDDQLAPLPALPRT